MARTAFQGKLVTPCCRVVIPGFPDNKYSIISSCPECRRLYRYTKNYKKRIIDAEELDANGNRL